MGTFPLISFHSETKQEHIEHNNIMIVIISGPSLQVSFSITILRYGIKMFWYTQSTFCSDIVSDLVVAMQS
jgi:hypothetical protein